MTEPVYLIIGGTAKAGTTSVFHYLAAHPDVCASHTKETGFFLDADYPFGQGRRYRYEDGLEKYQWYFAHCSNKPIRLEATHAYLYSPGTPERLRASLPNLRLVFMLRDPIMRLVSFYRYAKQYDPSLAHMGFSEFVEQQFTDDDWTGSRGLAGGRYSIYLKAYFDLFERSDICIIQYETLRKDTTTVMEKLCQFVGIDPTMYRRYNFHIHNRTRTIRNYPIHRIYLALRRHISRRRVLSIPQAQAKVPSLQWHLEQLYFRLNSSRDEVVEIPESLQQRLEDYYRNEPTELSSLLGGEALAWSFINKEDQGGKAKK